MEGTPGRWSEVHPSWTELVVAVGVFLLATALWASPVVAQLGTHIPGDGADGPIFLWNAWRLGRALDGEDAGVFTTHLLGHPLEHSLIAHTHTLLNSALTVLLERLMTWTAAFNLVVLGHFVMTCIGAFWLGRRLGLGFYPAIFAGFVFSFGPYKLSKMLGHFNLTSTSGIPFFVLAVLGMIERPGERRWPILAALSLGVTIWNSYYYAVFLIIFAVLALFHRAGTLTSWASQAGDSSGTRLAERGLTLAFWVMTSLLVLVLLWGPLQGAIGPLEMSLGTTATPIALLAGVWLVRGFIRKWMMSRHEGNAPRFALLHLFSGGILAIVLFSALSFPLLTRLLSGIVAFDVDPYLAVGSADHYAPDLQRFVDPSGNTLLGYVLNRPDRSGSIEKEVYLGIPILFLGTLGLMSFRRHRLVRLLGLAAIAFTLLSFGPYLKLGGERVHDLFLPAGHLATLPIFERIRNPGRYVVIALLCWSLLGAFGMHALAAFRASRRGVTRHISTVGGVLLMLMVAADLIPVRMPIQSTAVLPVVSGLDVGAGGDGAVLCLPFGVQDAWQNWGRFDTRHLIQQIVHQRPLIGGFLAYFEGGLFDHYRKITVLRDFARIQQGIETSPIDGATRRRYHRQLSTLGVRYILIDWSRFAPGAASELRDYLAEALNVRPVGRSGPVGAFRVTNAAQRARRSRPKVRERAPRGERALAAPEDLR